MAVRFEIHRYLEDHPIARKIIEYLSIRKAATVYQVAEAIKEKPSDFEEYLSPLQTYGIVRLYSDYSQKSSLQASVYMLTGYGHEVAATIANGSVKR